MSAWQSFLLRYLLVAVIGTALIIVLIPRIQGSPHSSLVKAVVARLQQDSPGPDPLRPGHSIVPSIKKAVTPGFEAARRDLRQVAPPAAQLPQPTPDPPPAPEQGGERWAVVFRASAPYYSTTGKFLGHATPGALLQVEAVKQNRSELLAVCKSASDPTAEPILIPAKSLDMYAGDLDNLDAQVKQLYVQRAQLQGEIDTRRRQRETEVRTENPHAAKYVSIRNEYRAFWNKVKDLQAKRDGAEGAAHMGYADELRLLKGRDITVRQAYQEAKQKYVEWNERHPRTGGNDPQTRRLAAAVARIEEQIAQLDRAK